MEYPNLLYKDGGNYQRPGGTYSFRQVHSDEERDSLKADGWVESVAALCGVVEKVVEVVSDAVQAFAEVMDACDDETAPPTRAELEAKAAELGLKYHHKTGDAKLAKLIEDAISGVE